MERILRLFVLKLGRLPLGIWVAWLGIAYAGAAFFGKLTALAGVATMPARAIEEDVATWAVIIAAAVALLRRRLIARTFGGMAMTLLFFHCLFHGDDFGMVLALLVIPSLLANRRWFDEKLPRIGW